MFKLLQLRCWFLNLRKLFSGCACTRQFSVSSGTIAHRSRLDLSTWFLAAEFMVNAYSRDREDHLLTGRGLAGKFQLSYVTAYKLKRSFWPTSWNRQVGCLGVAFVCPS